MHAWYSATAAKQFGYIIYLSENNEKVQVTCCGKDIECGKGYLWEDKVYIGKVKQFVKRIPSPNMLAEEERKQRARRYFAEELEE